MNQLPVIRESQAVASTHASSIVAPTMMVAAGDQAARRFLEFFAVTIRNKNTRLAHCRAGDAVLRLVPSPQARSARRDRACRAVVKAENQLILHCGAPSR
jgi:hypothetical protein